MNDHSNVLGIVRGIPGLEDLDAERSAVLASMAALASLPEGAVAYREDEATRDVYYIVSGLLESRMRIPALNGAEDVFRTLKSGDVFGETAWLDGGRRGTTTSARERSLVLRIDGDALRKACDADPTLGMAVYRLLGRTSAARCRETSLELRNSIGGRF